MATSSSPTIKTRLLILSDTHANDLPDYTQYQADAVIHCGDLTTESKLHEFKSAITLLRSLNAPLKLVIAGNHDFTLDTLMFRKKINEVTPPLDPSLVKTEYDDYGEARNLFTEAQQHGIVFLDEGTHIFTLQNGARMKVYASPYIPSLGDWGFQYHPEAGHDFDLEKDTDVVITHGPLRGIMDATYSSGRAGCPHLFAAIARARPRMHCFGHIHEQWGAKLVGWRPYVSERPSHITDVDNGRSTVIAKLAHVTPDTRAIETSHCTGDPAPLEAGRQTLFVNAALEGTGDFPRRRTQIRTAQRAYRARNQAQVSTLKHRVAQLENALEDISKGVVSLSDSLVQLQVLSSHPQVADGLRDTVETCLALAQCGEEDDEPLNEHRHSAESSSSRQVLPSNRSTGMGVPAALPLPITSTSTNSNIYSSKYTHALSAAWFAHHPFPFNPDTYTATATDPTPSSPNRTMAIPTFIENIRIASLYHGFRLLNDPSIPLTILARPFRLLLPLVPRDNITSFFQARLNARLAKRAPEKNAEIPVFQLGGAGTHYRDGLGFVSNQKRNELYLDYGGWDVIHHSHDHDRPGDGDVGGTGHGHEHEHEHEPLSAFSPSIREELDGEWFDLNDLEGFLLERGVCLIMVTPRTGSVRDGSAVDVVNLTAELLRKAICLGHSPGFRKRDVEAALRSPQR
ncbi:hypothetical protein BJX70DRAFT_404919 [Aspergillus crustosus]